MTRRAPLSCDHPCGRTRKIGKGRYACPMCRDEMAKRLREQMFGKLAPEEREALSKPGTPSAPRRFSFQSYSPNPDEAV